jgi:hypothetical protein
LLYPKYSSRIRTPIAHIPKMSHHLSSMTNSLQIAGDNVYLWKREGYDGVVTPQQGRLHEQAEAVLSVHSCRHIGHRLPMAVPAFSGAMVLMMGVQRGAAELEAL